LESIYFSDEHAAFRKEVRRFVTREIVARSMIGESGSDDP
jgi:hypothetical protein